MKRLLISGLICALMLSASGCGEKQATESGSALDNLGQEISADLLDGEKETKATTEQKDVSQNTEDGSEAEEKGSTENSSKTEDKGQTEDSSKTEEKGRNEDANKSAQGDLYQAFREGTAKAKYRGTGDRTSYLEISKVLEVGKAYSMDEIVKAIGTVDEYSEFKLTSDIVFSEIDCGEDGVRELLVEAPFNEEFRLYMILKEIDGELVICFSQDGWSRSYVEVEPDGRIISSGSAGAAVHVFDYGYVNAKGEYQYYYGCEETTTLYGDFYAYTSGEDYKLISTEGLDADHLGVREYYFEPEYEKREYYYTYFVMDDNYNDITKDEDFDDSNELKKRFAEAGIKTYTQKEIDQILKDRATQIGYPVK